MASTASFARVACALGILVVCSAAHASGTIAWMTDYEAAKQKAQSTGKLLLVNIHMESCQPCKKLMAGTLRDPALIDEINETCVPLSLDFDRDRDIVLQWPVRAFPTQLFVAPDGRVLNTLVGNVAVSTYRSGLQRALQAAGVSTPAAPSPSALAARPRPALTEAVERPLDPFSSSAASSGPKPGALGALPPVQPQTAAETVATTPPAAPPEPSRHDADVRPCDLSMPLALRGYCPVSMIRQAELVPGRLEHCCVYKQNRYQFRSDEDLREFLNSPRKYLPSEEGFCVVTWAESHRRQSGSIDFPALFGDHLFLFANDEARRKFLKNPERYVDDAGRAHRIPLHSFRGEPGAVR
jgi:YHS domain-containing protein